MQVTTLSFENMHNHGELFANMLRARHKTFIEHKNWDLPQADGMEYDQYDTPASRWVAVHEFGQGAGGCAPDTDDGALRHLFLHDPGRAERAAGQPAAGFAVRRSAGGSSYLGVEPRVRFGIGSGEAAVAGAMCADRRDGAVRADVRGDVACRDRARAFPASGASDRD